MGQEISQQNKCSNIGRRQQQQPPQHHNSNKNNLKQPHQNYTTSNNNNNSNDKYTKHKDLIYTSSSISTTSSTTDDEHFLQRQKYNFPKQTYEKTKVAKKLSNTNSSSSTATDTTTTTTASSTPIISKYKRNSVISTKSTDSSNYSKVVEGRGGVKDNRLFVGLQQHQRKNSQSTDSGIYYSSCQCSSSAASTSSVGSTSGFAVSVASSSAKSAKSLDKQKEYLCQHLYIKSYLDILEEDEKARAHFKPARPGGIRNYKPKILTEAALSASAPATGFAVRQRDKNARSEDQWI